MQLLSCKIFSMSNKQVKSTTKRKKAKAVGIELQPVAIPEAHHAAWFQLLRVHAKVTQRIEQRLLKAKQIPSHWYDVLVTLEKAPDQRLRLSELADNLVTSRSNLTRLVDRLEAEGYLRRETCPGDQRGCYAVLTEAGAAARLKAWPIVSRGMVELFADLVTTEEATMMAEALGRVADSEVNTS